MNVKRTFAFVWVSLTFIFLVKIFYLDHGAYVVQLDFTEARLSLKVNPNGRLLKGFIAINNSVLDRFSPSG
jgi:hypothetical protein